MKNINKQKGSFILELMIGLVIATATILTAMTIYLYFENQKRITVETNQLLANLSVGMFAIQKSVPLAGYGLNPKLMQCATISAYDDTRPSGSQEFNLEVKSLQIIPEAEYTDTDIVPDPESSVLMLSKGDSEISYGLANMTQSMPNSSAAYKVDNRFGYKEGDLMIAISADGSQCILSQVTNLPGGGNSDNVIHNSGNYTDPVTGRNIPARYNKAGGIGAPFNVGDSLLNIGSTPVSLKFYLSNNQLRVKNEFDNTDKVIANNIVGFKAVALIDEDENKAIDKRVDWLHTSTDLTHTKGVKLLLVGKSSIPFMNEKDSTGNCSATTNSEFSWSEGVFDLSKIVGLDKDWKCYRYRLQESTIYLKNFNLN